MKTKSGSWGFWGKVGLFSVILLGGSLARSQNVPFAVSFYYPTNGQQFMAGTNLTLYVKVADANPVRTIQYFSGNTLLGTVGNPAGAVQTNSTTSLFSLVWSTVPAGSYVVTAVGTDAAGLIATSPPLNIIVTNLPPVLNVPFVVSFWYPTNGQHFVAPANVGLHALATGSNVIRTMQYFSGNTSLGILTNTGNVLFTNSTQANPFFLSWSNVPAGNYPLTAVATDATGRAATSAPVTIIITNPVPLCYVFSPTNNSTLFGPTNLAIYARAIEIGGTVASVQFFANSLNLGNVPLSQQTVFTNITTEPLFPLIWSNAPPGKYALKVVAMDTLGASTTSSVVNVTIVSNPPPVRPSVAIYSPTNGAKFVMPANVNIYASAVENNPGTVATVQFFANSLNLGVVSNSIPMTSSNTSSGPFFSLTWSNVPAGNYYLKAVATDAAGLTSTSSLVNISVISNTLPPIVPFIVSLTYPTNGQTFAAPTNITMRALVTDSNAVTAVQFFAGTNSLGIASNLPLGAPINATSGIPLYLTWSNAPAGSYALTAVATDSAGNTSASSVVNIVVSNLPPVPPSVAIYSPANGAKFVTPTNIYIYARAVAIAPDTVASVQFFANSLSLGIVSTSSQMMVSNISSVPLFPLIWSNAPAGNYYLKAVATDAAGLTSTSSLVSISVISNPPPPITPFIVSLTYPTNGQTYAAPANVTLRALVTDSNALASVQFFAGTTSLGIVSNLTVVQPANPTAGAPFYFTWSNAPAGNYALTAVATDVTGRAATSAPVTIYVVSSLPPVVSIYAPDPVAIEGTNGYNWFQPGTTVTNYITGTNTATFLVRRDSATNTDLTVYYAIGGTAINGLDYASLPGYVTIPAGQRYSLITILPSTDTDSSYRYYDTVILTLTVPPNALSAYHVGTPNSAGAVILEENFLPIPTPLIRNMADNTFHVSLPATNGMNFCLQVSTDMVNWLPVCTNTVLKGSAQFVDPSANAGAGLYYRIIPVNTPASY